MRTPAVIPAVLAALALPLAACGGDEDEQPVAAPLTAERPAAVTEQPPATAEEEPPREPTAPADEPEPRPLTAREALGQMTVARFAGTRPSAALLRRIRDGEVGGVILFADNTAGGTAATGRLVARLQAAARRGRRPKLLVLIDQEGGDVKRLPGPPATSAAGMTSEAAARRAGRDTGRLLRGLGITVDLAPVADVKRRADSFLGTRAFGTRPEVVADRACAFAAGLNEARVAATLKHFPGLGTAPANTDDQPTVVTASAAAIRRDLLPYRRCGRRQGVLVMMSSASYPALFGSTPAVLAPQAYRLVRRTAGSAVTVSDDLETPAVAAERTPARRSVRAGLDLLLYARTEAASANAYPRLVADVAAGRIPIERVRDAATRILALKASLARG
jgi:beta-N-acetylhexosaminidase